MPGVEYQLSRYATKHPSRVWRDAIAYSDECADEVMHALSQGNGPRAAQCRKWLAEALESEHTSRVAMIEAKMRAFAPDSKG